MVIDLKNSRAWCGRPYEGHAKGCPNFGKDKDCPPEVGLFSGKYDPVVRLAIVRFDFEDYLEKRRRKFPNISEKSLRNPLYWQSHVRAVTRKWAREVVEGDETIIEKPEAMGVDVTATCKKAGIILEWPPKKNVYRVTVLARLKVETFSFQFP